MSKAKLILTHALGNANVRAALSGFNSAGTLDAFYTAIACFENDILFKLGSINSLSEIRRRSFDSSLQSLTQTHPFREMGRLLATKFKLKSLTAHETGYFSIDQVLNELDLALAKRIRNNAYPDAKAVYAYEDGALNAFKAAHDNKMSCLYDLPIGYWRAARELMMAEKDAKPEWANTITGFNDSDAKLLRKDQELQLADDIFVASSFTAKTLQYFPGQLQPAHIIPYGFPDVSQAKNYTYNKNRKLKVLFVGGLSQRKGIAYLFEAANQFPQAIELTVVGNKTGVDCPALDKALSNCNWIPSLSHPEILALMKSMDVLIFPSLFEGFGLVITEAMSQGTPVITTDRTAGPDIIQHNVNGWITEAGSTQALSNCLESIIEQPDLLNAVGSAAYKTAAQRPWKNYSNELNTAVEKVLAKTALQHVN